MKYFDKIKHYLTELNLLISYENEEDGLFIVNEEENGVFNLIIGCVPPLLVMEQALFKINNNDKEAMKFLLEQNRTLVHGAFVLDASNGQVLYRDTLQIENLDLNEIEASINSLRLLLSEHYQSMAQFKV